MKKNVFSRAIAVLGSMAVLGAASMMSASAAAGIIGDSVEAQPGVTVEVPFYMADANATGGELTFSVGAPLTITDLGTASASEISADGSTASGVWFKGDPYGTAKAFTKITVDVAADAEPGEYPINVSITSIAIDGVAYSEGTVTAGTVVIPDNEPDPTDPPATDPEPTDAPTAAPTAVVTTVATTKAPNTGSPKTGTAGVAVAVAGLVTAGATAVVLKKKH